MGSSPWVECELADVCSSIDYGYTAAARDDSRGVRFLRITDIVQPHLAWDTVPYVEADEATFRKYRLDDGDIVLARTGASTGSSAYIQNPPEAVFASYLVRLKIKPTFDARFVSYYLKSDLFWSYIRGVLGDKSAQPNASASTMVRAPFRAPSDIVEQRRISGILGALDDKIELNRRMSQTLESMARTVFKSWCEPSDSNCDQAASSELSDVTSAWKRVSLVDLADVVRDVVDPARWPDRVFSHYSIPAFDQGRQPTTELGSEIGSIKFQVAPGSVMVSKLNPSIPRVWLVDEEPAANPAASTEFMILRPRHPATTAYLYCLARSSGFRSDLEALATGTSGSHQRAQRDAVLAMQVTIPPPARIDGFDGLASPLLRRVARCQSSAAALVAIREALLPTLLSDHMAEVAARSPGS